MLALLAVFGARHAIACSCLGIEPIGSALGRADAVVVGRVMAHVPAQSSDADRWGTVKLEVLETLSGRVPGTIDIAKSMQCYQSFDEDELKVAHQYVFPLWRVEAGENRPFEIGSESARTFELPACAHNALLLDGRTLYTSELTSDGGRELQYYMPLPLMKALLSMGLLRFWRVETLMLVSVVLVTVLMLVPRRRGKTDKESAPTPPLRLRARRLAIVFTWLALVVYVFALIDMARNGPAGVSVGALGTLLILGVALAANHSNPVHPLLAWTAMALCAGSTLFGLTIYASEARGWRMLMGEHLRLLLFVLPFSLSSLCSLFGRRHEWKQRRSVA